MITLYVTFGHKYYHEDHTYLPRWAADPDGWLEVRADTREHATGLLAKYVGATPSSAIECAGIYDTVEAVEPQWYERGCVGWIDTDGLHRAEVTPLTDALDRAAQALREEFLRPVSKTWEHASADTQRLWRDSAAAAVRVMADDLRACHKPSYREAILPQQLWDVWQCVECLHPWPCETVRILDTYTGSSDA